MAEAARKRYTHEQIAENDRRAYKLETYIKGAESFIKPGYKDASPFSRALDELKAGLIEAERIGTATPDVYDKLGKEAESLKGRVPEKGNFKPVLNQYEDFIMRCKNRAGR